MTLVDTRSLATSEVSGEPPLDVVIEISSQDFLQKPRMPNTVESLGNVDRYHHRSTGGFVVVEALGNHVDEGEKCGSG